MLVFQVDLFSARGGIPCDLLGVTARQKDIRYSSRTRLTTNVFRTLHAEDVQIRTLLAKVPEERLTVEERALKERLTHLPKVSLIHMIYQRAADLPACRL